MSHVAAQLTAYLDGALEPRERGAVEAHLATCPDCRGHRDRIARALAVLRALPPPPEPSPQFEQRFRARLARERSRPAGLLARLPWRWLAPAAAAGAVAAALVGVEVRDRRQQAFVAGHLELLESFEVVASVGDVDEGDAELVAHLHELEGGP